MWNRVKGKADDDSDYWCGPLDRWIGFLDHRPAWCPLLAGEKRNAEADQADA